MGKEKCKPCYILMGIICLAVTLLLTKPVIVFSVVYNDAYSYEDSFEDTSGLNLSETDGFESSGGALQAIKSPAVVVSECISLPQPAGGTFQGWSFLNIEVESLGTGSNTLEVQDCSGTALVSVSGLPEGESTIDMSGISETTIRLMWEVDQVGARLNFWNIYGTASGVTCIDVFPDSNTVKAGDTVTFTITVSTSGAMARNPVLSLSLDDINGLHTPALDDGLAEDAEVDYGSGNGVVTYRPLEFVFASSGPNGEPTAAEPGLGATSGEVVWNLNDLNDGFSDNVIVILRVPQGYIDGKSLAARAMLGHGVSSGMYTNIMSVEETSGLVTVNSVAFYNQYLYTNYNNLAPGATNIYEYPYVVSPLPVSNPSDTEDITITITGVGTCSPLFRDLDVAYATDFQIVSTPAVGAPITGANPVIVHIDRGDFLHRYFGIQIYYDVPVACTEGNTIGTQSVLVAGMPSWTDTDSVFHNVVLETCRRGNNHIHRVMSGNDPGNYYFWPGWHEYYISNGSLRAGEYFTSWMPYGNESYRTHTITLDHSYDLIEIPEGITFHGIRQINGLNRLYKDSTGTGPVPTDPAFDPNTDPPHPAWKPVDITWDGAPLSNPPDENDSRAVALPGCRLLGVKDHDTPAWEGPDYGHWTPVSLWRTCDGSYGCAELPDGTAMSLVGGTIFTYETVTDPAGAAHQCITHIGWTLYKESKSWPKVYSWAEENQVPAGQVAHIILNPENRNYASQWVDGRWVVNLYGIREYIDLAGITGEVLTEGNIPNPDQNVLGESCDIANDITFHFPDPTGCSSAVSEDDSACMAWWEVPPACQPPNGWGYRISGNYFNDDFVQMYRFRLNAPILNTTPAGAMLDFVTEVRTTDLSAKGADNAVDTARWSSNNYTAASSVAVLEMPGLDVEKAGPSAKKPGDTVTYTLEITNYGNTPNNGWYMVDWLPRDGINSSEFTPEYGKAYASSMPADLIIEYSRDAGCFANPLAGTWTAMTLQATTRIGYQAETVSSLDPNATCMRLRQNPVTTVHFNPGDTILAAIDVVIPNDGSLVGNWLYNRALAGADTIFGASSEVAHVETINVRTKVSTEIIVEVNKTFQIDPARAGWIKGMIRVHNASGVDALDIHVVDELPDEVMYEGLSGSLPSGWSLLEEPATGESGGRIRLMIDELSPDDGNPGTGEDEGTIAFWMRVIPGTPAGTVIRNCTTATPEYGTGGESCALTSVPDIESTKGQEAVDRIPGTTITDVVPGDEISYTITVRNRLENATYLWIHDDLDTYVDYIPGTFTVNGAAASDSFISGGTLNYEYPDPVDPNEALTLTLDVRVKGGEYDSWTIGNTAQILACTDPLDPSSCYSSIDTPAVYALAFCDKTDSDSDNFTICGMDCDDSDPNAYPGALELCDGKDNDCDGQKDNDLVRDCSTPCGTGTETCVNGEWVNCTAPPCVIIHATPDSGCIPLAVVFEAETSGISDPNQSWEFGDGNSTTEIDPVYQYDIPGIYIATLTMTDDDGGPVQASVTIQVEPFCYSYTQTSVFVYGNVEIKGEGLDVGNWIGAFADGVVVNDGCIGRWQITDKGEYGAMVVYGDDPTTPEKDGAAENDQIIFKAYVMDEGKIVPLNAEGPDDPIWVSGFPVLNINLTSARKQEIPLCEGWNLISFSINHCYYEGTSPSVFIPAGVIMKDLGADNDSMELWLSNDANSPLRDDADPTKAGNWRRIISFDSEGSHVMDSDILPKFNTLKYLSAGYGYWLKMNAPGTLVLKGEFLPAGTSLTLQYGWNLMGYIPHDTCYTDIDQASVCPYASGVYTTEEGIIIIDSCPVDPMAPYVFASIEGQYRRVIAFDCCAGATIYDTDILPKFNTLHYMGPKYGYWIKIEDMGGAVLTFPEDCPGI